MPIFRYFVFVGGALIALLFAVNLALPQETGDRPAVVASGADLPLIRIRSERKLPERVVLDTSQPTIVPPTAVAVVSEPTAAKPADPSAKAEVRQSFAQYVPSARRPGATTAKRGESVIDARTRAQPQSPPKRKVARTRSAPAPGRPMMLVAQQPHFGLFNTTW